MIENREENRAPILKDLKKFKPDCDVTSYLESLLEKRQDFENNSQNMLIFNTLLQCNSSKEHKDKHCRQQPWQSLSKLFFQKH